MLNHRVIVSSSVSSPLANSPCLTDILQQLIYRGFKVRGTVRSKEKGEYLTKEVVKGSKNFEYVIVEDVETEGAFNEAVKGVDAVLHTGESRRDSRSQNSLDSLGDCELETDSPSSDSTASPFHFNVQDPWKDLIDPAVKGTKNLLQAVATEKGIKRVVITSSFAAIVNPYDPVYVFKEDEDWNEYSPKQVEEKGKDVDPAREKTEFSLHMFALLC